MSSPVPAPPTLRIFISSPADVRPERLIANQVVQRLGREFSYHCRIEPVLWEREPLVVSSDFQAQIIHPHDADIVVVVVWSLLGVPLPQDKYPGPISGNPVTGTEWEFEDALASYRAKRTPELLLYRKKVDVVGSLEDEVVVQTRLAQKRLVENFMIRWTRSADGAFTAAFREFENADLFQHMLYEHLTELILRKVTVSAGAPIRWHKGSPFRGLESFEVEHESIFFGRTRARNELRELLTRQVARGTPFVLVIGASGSGKSSLVKAGLLADLRIPGMVGSLALCRYARVERFVEVGPYPEHRAGRRAM
jgi:conflict system STAND superfamily ATPase